MVALSNPTSVLLVLHSNHLISGHRYLVVSLATRTGHEAIRPYADALFNGVDKPNEGARPGGQTWPLCWLSEADPEGPGPLSVRLLAVVPCLRHGYIRGRLYRYAVPGTCTQRSSITI